jgi:hypothetical protein
MTFVQGHALVVGVGSYRNAPRINVPVAVSDSQAVAAALQDPSLCAYPPEQVELLRDEAATREGILAALERLGQRTSPGDTAFLFHVGHGDYGTDGAYYLVSHDTRIEGSKVAAGSGVSQVELLEALKKVPAGRVLIIFNTCHSAELAPSFSLEPSFGTHILPNSAAEALLSTGSGRIILTACKEDQLSYIGRGALSWFTQSLVDALHGQGVAPRGGAISAYDLYTSVYESVHTRVMDELQREQDPVLTVLKGVGPFAVALYQGQAGDLSLAEAAPGPQAGVVRPVTDEESRQAFQQIMGDLIDARSSQGFINRPSGPVNQHFGDQINTGGGAYVGGSVNTGGGAFVGRDQSISTPQTEASLEQFLELLEQLRAALPAAGLDAGVRQIAESDLQNVESGAQAPQPNGSLILYRLKGVRSLLEEAAKTGAAAVGMAQIAGQLVELAQRLFG